MPHRTNRRAALFALALGLAALAPAAQALNIQFKDIGTTPMSAAQLGALQTAANYWQSQVTDNVTVYLNVSFADLGANELASTTTDHTVVRYDTLRGLLAADARSATDASAVGHLQSGPALSFKATQGDGVSRLDTDGSANNRLIYVATANAKALGQSTVNDITSPDARIRFANAFAGSFAYTRNGGVPAHQIDFITVAEHEIGHALGFVSGVDDVDFCLGHSDQCGTSNTVNRFEGEPWYKTLDLFRYSAPGQLDVSVGGTPYLSVDGGATVINSFSTGAYHGDGAQASHFGSAMLSLMQPTVHAGQSYDATAADLMALDAIGWNLAAAVPEPETCALMLGGLAMVAGVAHRRKPA